LEISHCVYKVCFKFSFWNLDDADGNYLHKELINQQTNMLSKTTHDIENILQETLKSNPLHRDETCFYWRRCINSCWNDYDESLETLNEKKLLVDNLNENIQLGLETNIEFESPNTQIYRDLESDIESTQDAQIYTDLDLDIEPTQDAQIYTDLDSDIESAQNNKDIYEPLIPDEYFEIQTDTS